MSKVEKAETLVCVALRTVASLVRCEHGKTLPIVDGIEWCTQCGAWREVLADGTASRDGWHCAGLRHDLFTLDLKLHEFDDGTIYGPPETAREPKPLKH